MTRKLPDLPEKNGVTRGTLNVFADLGFPDPELHLAKANVVSRIMTAVAADGLAPDAAAERLGLTPPRYKAMIRGRFAHYSVDRLVSMLNKLGRRVDIHISTAAPPAG